MINKTHPHLQLDYLVSGLRGRRELEGWRGQTEDEGEGEGEQTMIRGERNNKKAQH